MDVWSLLGGASSGNRDDDLTLSQLEREDPYKLFAQTATLTTHLLKSAHAVMPYTYNMQHTRDGEVYRECYLCRENWVMEGN